MTIVASNSLTLSNVNDGTITHTAYAYSADGTDGFTTVYPNLNLIENGKFAKPISSNWYTDGTTISKDDITGYFKVKFNGTGSMNRTYYGGSISTIPIGQKYSVYIKAYSLESSQNIKMGSVNTSQAVTVTNNSNIPKTYKVEGLVRGASNTFGIFGGLTTTLGTLFISEIKLEQGSTATPWMPSSSEVKTADWPSYIGTYSDSNVESSLDYKKYQWAIFKGQNSNAYMAYSWSADGTDRFTTAYPNLNLLDGSKFPDDKLTSPWGSYANGGTVVISNGEYNYTTPSTGTGSGQQGGLLYTDTSIMTTQKSYTWSAKVKGSGTIRITYQYTYTDGTTSPWIQGGDTTLTSNYSLAKAIILPQTKAFTKVVLTLYFQGTSTGSIKEPKLEEGSIVTPWTPSESEFQDQWQDAIPMYVGLGEKDSQNPSDYRWQLNPRYVQASSDNGLSSKAGVDDLASVGNTANDALVQAQNAVSNEDYTSWLEHDYQSTIDNLQEISAQNQDDIKNVDDRTTIVEGFYGEMKVKWNFIDESFSFSEEGMFISNAQSKMSIQITSDKIVFWDNNVDVAFITGEVLNIQKGVFLESATIGNHLITKFSDDSPVTIIRYVGGIT